MRTEKMISELLKKNNINKKILKYKSCCYTSIRCNLIITVKSDIYSIVIGIIMLVMKDENFVMKRTTFDKCYNDFMKKVFWIIIIYIIANIIWIILYLLGKIEYDTFIIFIFFGNIFYIVNRIPVMKTYRFIRILNRTQMKSKLQQIILWNDLDAFFLETNIVHYYKRKIYYIDYNNIKSIYRFLFKCSSSSRGYTVFNLLVNDYLVIRLKTGEKYKVKIDSYLESVAHNHTKTEEMVSELLKKNDKILVEETKVRLF